MATIIKCTGPAVISVGTAAGPTLEVLGYSQQEVRISLASDWEDVLADYGGTRVPVDTSYMGESATISFDLINWDDAVLTKLRARVPGTGVAGAIPANEIGTLMISENKAVQIYIAGQYGGKFANMVPIWNFPKGWLADNLEVPISTRAQTMRCVLRAIPFWNASSLTATLYTNS